MAPRNFKTDESFLEKIAIGAIGTKRVFIDLTKQGHRPVELERGSMSYTIWKAIKIKRFRMPDILCVNCGLRFESRAKSDLQITMSHSFSDPERGWDANLSDEDWVALVWCKKTGESPIAWEASELVQYIAVKDLREVFKQDKIFKVTPKGAQEGFEARITWPAAIARGDGVVVAINDKLKYRKNERAISLNLVKRGIKLTPLIKPSESFIESQILAAVVPVHRKIICKNDHSGTRYTANLASLLITERYAGAKALSYFKLEKSIPALLKVLRDDKEHIYVKLEAAAALMRAGSAEGIEFIQKCLMDEYLENRLEAVIILGEIKTDKSCELLSECLLDKDQHPEIRAGAAWSLGELGAKAALAPLVQSFLAVELNIRIQAARALAKVARQYGDDVLKRFPEAEIEQRPGLAWAIQKSGIGTLNQLMEANVDIDARQWIAYIIGMQESDKYVDEIEKLKARDPELYFAVTVLWKIVSSWIHELEEY